MLMLMQASYTQGQAFDVQPQAAQALSAVSLPQASSWTSTRTLDIGLSCRTAALDLLGPTRCHAVGWPKAVRNAYV